MAEQPDSPKTDVTTLVEDATFDYTMGDNDAALAKLKQAVELDRDSFDAWHAMTEVYFSMREFREALQAAEQAFRVNGSDIHINTSLSRIHMELGDKPTAEHFGAQARMLGWKQQLQEPDED
ncbi:tetratricopeptide repeat protein [Cerasicoccus maritimus]|uniref:tetratricopeptide repeat protein n=1 Tax=Cerasicoccus maritimus TaxID=490089 RepID=UPI002852D605|nr:tetratricopeptide repeat protein [Cerasicoccus maritimus]